jgi:hypothetical protein
VPVHARALEISELVVQRSMPYIVKRHLQRISRGESIGYGKAVTISKSGLTIKKNKVGWRQLEDIRLSKDGNYLQIHVEDRRRPYRLDKSRLGMLEVFVAVINRIMQKVDSHT